MNTGKQQIWFQHVGVWLFYYLVVTGIASLYEGDSGRAMFSYALQLPAMVLSGYLLFYYLFPKLRKDWTTIIWIAASIIIYLATTLFNRWVMASFIYPVLYSGDHSFEFWNLYRMANQFLLIFLSHALFGVFKSYTELQKTQKDKRALSEEKRQAEVSFLRAQVHPHFLFNSLNALYSELVAGNSDAPNTLLRLTGIYRFILEECNEESIALKKEWKLIRDYAELEQKRYGSRLRVELEDLPQRIQENKIPPLIYFSLVENAFKHGVSAQEAESFVKIRIQENQGKLILFLRNSLFEEQPNLNGHQGGIGLENTKRQLELSFGKDYSLVQEKGENEYLTRLELPLKL